MTPDGELAMTDPEDGSRERGPGVVEPAAAEAVVSAVNLKLPPFWPSDPEIWFRQVEAQFRTRGITTQKTKFDYIVSSLSPEFATEVRDLIIKPPADTPYDTIREQLIRRTTASEQRKLQQLFSTEQLGDQKPSQLLRRLQQLLGEHASTTDSTFLRELFLRRLPNNVQMILASTSNTSSLDELAELADKIMDIAVPPVAGIQNSSPQLNAKVDQLHTEVTRLQELVKSLSHSRHHRPSRRPSTPRPISPHPSTSPRPPSPSNSEVCWYHQKYGESARKCKPPCAMSNNTAPR